MIAIVQYVAFDIFLKMMKKVAMTADRINRLYSGSMV